MYRCVIVTDLLIHLAAKFINKSIVGICLSDKGSGFILKIKFLVSVPTAFK